MQSLPLNNARRMQDGIRSGLSELPLPLNLISLLLTIPILKKRIFRNTRIRKPYTKVRRRGLTHSPSSMLEENMIIGWVEWASLTTQPAKNDHTNQQPTNNDSNTKQQRNNNQPTTNQQSNNQPQHSSSFLNKEWRKDGRPLSARKNTDWSKQKSRKFYKPFWRN